MLKRALATLLALCIIMGCAAVAEPAVEDSTAKSAPHTIEGITYPYLRQFTDEEKKPVESEMPLYFIDGGDIPYAKLSEYMSFLSGLLKDIKRGDIQYEIEDVSDDSLTGIIVHRIDNDSVLFVDYDKDVLTFDNFNTFTQTVGTKALVSSMDLPENDNVDPVAVLELLISGMNGETGNDAAETGQEGTDQEDASDGQTEDSAEADGADATDVQDSTEGQIDVTEETPHLFGLKEGVYVNRAGSWLELDLADYDIDIIAQDGECYIPFQTLNDLLITDTYIQYVFDGEKVLGSGYGCSLINEMDSAPKHMMSEEFAKFNYNELRLLLDCMYGLKPEHNISDFDTFLYFSTDLAIDMNSTDPQKFDIALAKLLLLYFDDLHSGFIRGSYLYDRNEAMDMLVNYAFMGPSAKRSMSVDPFADARKKVYRAWVPGYEEVGDTAFITFDVFSKKRNDYYNPMIDRDNPEDTVDLIIYADNQIKREGSPIKNIVLDLSNNGGGDVSAAIFVLAWFLGKADIALRDTFTGAQTNAMYVADVNLDGQFTDEDNVATGYNLYCLTTHNSFSCGNIVPAACSTSGKVTLVGQRSGGGSCVVLPCTTASGAVFQISGNKQISIIRNGSFYNADTGIEPDIYLSKPESFYDRAALVEFLHEVK